MQHTHTQADAVTMLRPASRAALYRTRPSPHGACAARARWTARGPGRPRQKRKSSCHSPAARTRQPPAPAVLARTIVLEQPPAWQRLAGLAVSPGRTAAREAGEKSAPRTPTLRLAQYRRPCAPHLLRRHARPAAAPHMSASHSSDDADDAWTILKSRARSLLLRFLFPRTAKKWPAPGLESDTGLTTGA